MDLLLFNIPWMPPVKIGIESRRRSIAEAIMLIVRKVIDSSGSCGCVADSRLMDVLKENEALINKICFYYASSREDYEDLRQDTIVNIWRGLATFGRECKESTWIYRICMNTCITAWRRDRKHRGGMTLDSMMNLASETDTTEEDVRQLHYLISRLPPDDKALIMLWLDEKSYDEISEVTGYNRNTVATKLRRIKEKIRKESQRLSPVAVKTIS